MRHKAILCCSVLLWAAPAAAEPWDKPGWGLTFHDEFDAESLDTTAWRPGYRWGEIVMNEEMQAYVSDAFAFEEGTLRIVGTDEPRSYAGQTLPYASGVITSVFEQRYGLFEIRCRMPVGRGFWTAFWLMPVGWDFWSGMKVNEIDIHEFLGHETATMYMTLHWGDDYQGGHVSAGEQYGGPDFTGDFHTYAVDWDADRVVWMVDGVERFRYEGPGVPQVDMYVITNLAIGGSWPGAPDSSTPFPAYYDIDYVRVYERGSDAGVTLPAEPVDADAAPPDAPDTSSGPAVSDASDGLDALVVEDKPRAVDAAAVEGSSRSDAWWDEGEDRDGCSCHAAGGRGHEGLFRFSLAALIALLWSRRGR